MTWREHSLNLFGLRIERQTDFVALAAFLLSLAGVSWQAAIQLRGPDVQFHPPDEIVLFANICEPNEQLRFLEAIAAMTYTNTGPPDFNDVVLDEKVHVSFPSHYNLSKTQLSQGPVVVLSDNDLQSGEHSCDAGERRDYPKLSIEHQPTTSIVTIGGGSAVSRSIHFYADASVCDSRWSNCEIQGSPVYFEQLLSRLMPGHTIELEFHSRFLKEGYRVGRCSITFGQPMIDRLSETYNLPTSCSLMPADGGIRVWLSKVFGL